MRRSRVFPFSWLPASWGLKGKTRKIAEIEYYYYEGEEKDRLINSLEEDNFRRNIKDLEIDLKYEKITELEFEKKTATLKDEPWVNANIVFDDPKKPNNGRFEVDYNEIWIQQLREKGFSGNNDDEILDKWIKSLNAQVLYESGITDIGMPDEDEQIIKEQLDDGRTSYS